MTQLNTEDNKKESQVSKLKGTGGQFRKLSELNVINTNTEQ